MTDETQGPPRTGFPPSTTAKSAPRKRTWAAVSLFVAAGLIGFVIRFAVARWSLGTNDIVTWERFAAQVKANGVLYQYAHDTGFNHPPLMGQLARASLWFSELVGIRFAVAFKLPVIFADMAAAFLVAFIWFRRRGWPTAILALALYSMNPVSILVSAHHGNTDCLCASLVLLSAFFCGEFRLPFWAGLALGAAINVKLIPAFCVPAILLAGQHTRKDVLHFLGGLALGVVPFLPIIFVCWADFHRNAIAYNSNLANWGVTYFLRTLGGDRRLAAWSQSAVISYQALGRKLIELSVVFASTYLGIMRRADVYRVTAVSIALFLIFAPGFGIQYLAYMCPILFAVSSWWGFAYSMVAGSFAGLVYFSFWTGSEPWHSHFNSDFVSTSQPFGGLAWGLLIVFVVQTLSSAASRSEGLAFAFTVAQCRARFAAVGRRVFARR